MTRSVDVAVRMLLVVGSLSLLGLLVGCDKSLGGQNMVSPRTDVQITGIVVPGGSVLSPILVSTGGQGGTTKATSLEFPSMKVAVSLYNGVTVYFSRFSVKYYQSNGVTPLGVDGLGGVLTGSLQGGEPGTGVSSTQLTLPAVSTALRSFLAGPDGKLGTADDNPAMVSAKITLAGTDINQNDFVIAAYFGITARPQISPEGVKTSS
ncbi:MAG: hypothetical protein HY815_22210 [Candidatus Riflebacteria bacterium]|nr:hypothetical protein [Candidatus Riflebacteria bacterium]